MVKRRVRNKQDIMGLYGVPWLKLFFSVLVISINFHYHIITFTQTLLDHVNIPGNARQFIRYPNLAVGYHGGSLVS